MKIKIVLYQKLLGYGREIIEKLMISIGRVKPTKKRSDQEEALADGVLLILIPNPNYCNKKETKKLADYFVFCKVVSPINPKNEKGRNENPKKHSKLNGTPEI